MESKIFQIRPDIFVKSGPGRIRIQRQGQNYILKVPANVADCLFNYIDLTDGERTFAEVIAQIPSLFHDSVRQFHAFLLSKNLAFEVKNSFFHTHKELSELGRYLAQFLPDPIIGYNTFAEPHYLLVGDGHSPFSCIKSLANLGIRALDVVTTDQFPEYAHTELVDAFNDSKTCVDAQIAIYDSFDSILFSKYGRVLHLQQHFDKTLYEFVEKQSDLAQASLLQGYQNGKHLFVANHLHKHYCNLSPNPDQIVSPMCNLVAGATFATCAFDHITDVCAIKNGHYVHYDLEAFGHLKQSRQVIMTRTSEIAASDPCLFDAFSALEDFLNQPLFPLQNLSAVSHPASYINIKSVNFSYMYDDVEFKTQLFGIGFDENECLQDIMESLLIKQGVWFKFDQRQQQAAKVRAHYEYFKNQLATANLVPHNDSEEMLTSVWSKKAEYVDFCIQATYGDSTQISVLSCQKNLWIKAQVKNCAVILPIYNTVTEMDVERIMLKLYLQIWLSRRNDLIQESVLILPHKTSLFNEEIADAKTHQAA